MQVELVPLLRVQRDLLDIPRGMARFEAYLRAMLNEARDDVRFPPLGVMNPMAREHVATLLDDYLALDADAEAARAIESAVARIDGLDVAFKVALVVVDDLRGGWTNRYAIEFAHPVGTKEMIERGWFSGLLWSSEAASPARAREAVLTTIYRLEHLLRHGPPRTLRDRLAHEGYALAKAGCTRLRSTTTTWPTPARSWPPCSTRRTSGRPSNASGEMSPPVRSASPRAD